jgi:hypothetical protein
VIFHKYLLLQADRMDAVGDLARYVRDELHGKQLGPTALWRHLFKNGIDLLRMQAVVSATYEFQARPRIKKVKHQQYFIWPRTAHISMGRHRDARCIP